MLIKTVAMNAKALVKPGPIGTALEAVDTLPSMAQEDSVTHSSKQNYSTSNFY